MVPLVLLVHPDPPWSTFLVKFQKVWIRMDWSGPGGPWGPQPTLVDQERSGPPWTTLRHFPDATAAKMFDVNAVSIRSRQLRQRKQVRNTGGTFNRHGGNNIILTEAQEVAVYRFCHEQWEMGIAATLAIIFAVISHPRQAGQRNPPSQVWFQQWLKKNPSLHTIKTKPIARARIMTHTEEDLKTFFVNYQNALSKYNIDKAKYIYNMDEFGVRIGCPAGEVVIVPTEVKELYTSSPENRQSVTIIEAICADGRPPPPPVIICPGAKIMESWIHENLIGAEVITVSPTGYTNENIALA